MLPAHLCDGNDVSQKTGLKTFTNLQFQIKDKKGLKIDTYTHTHFLQLIINTKKRITNINYNHNINKNKKTCKVYMTS